jgi:hypothetical protein
MWFHVAEYYTTSLKEGFILNLIKIKFGINILNFRSLTNNKIIL